MICDQVPITPRVGSMASIRFDQLMQLSQMIKGHGGVHMMLDVVIHLPIEKAQQLDSADYRTCVDAVVADLV